MGRFGLRCLSTYGKPPLSRDRRSVLEHVLDGYQRATPLADGWADHAGLRQLFPLLMDAVFFGRGYAEQSLKTARAALAR
ncbi:hypothetical protein [Streptomyces avermitilis]|uniref:hypothetical protein n=1 Tax=Streptomyces avermitilis TaxID=33903 RepID=UPI0037FA4B27